MPELPELQAHAERLDASFAGSTISGFRALTFTALKTATPDPSSAHGHPLDAVGRRGKYLLLDVGDVTFVVHLMQGGRLKPDEKQSAKPRGGIARWTFADDRALLLTEPGNERKAGIGRRLANEICHRAQLSPFAASAKLKAPQVEALQQAIAGCITDSLADERSRGEMVKAADRTNAVHHRAGEPCRVCGDTVRSVTYRAYEVDYCPTCQTGGKVLADNTTSKFLK